MNLIADFLTANQERFGLGETAVRSASYVAVTPRFQASKHVIFLVVPRGMSEPSLVAKLARMPGMSETLAREAANLNAAQAPYGGQLACVPRVIAYEHYRNHELLIETALPGRALDPTTIRRRGSASINRVFHWLVKFQVPTAAAATEEDAWFDRLVEGPLACLAHELGESRDDERRLETTWRHVGRLAGKPLPLAFTHGDLAHPNLIELRTGNLGVVDWELADPRGLPLDDAIFFLMYVAFARAKATSGEEYVQAFDRAFFDDRGWAMPYLVGYARKLGIEAEDIPPLFAACCTRLVSRLFSRVSPEDQPRESLVSWARRNRYYLVWRHAIERLELLRWQRWHGLAPEFSREPTALLSA